jgi:hypothetical protein
MLRKMPPAPTTCTSVLCRAPTNDYIRRARVIVFLDGRPSSEFTDSRGRFFFNLGEIPNGTGGLLYSSAPNFTTLKRNFVITGSSMNYAFPFQPIAATSSRRQAVRKIAPQSETRCSVVKRDSHEICVANVVAFTQTHDYAPAEIGAKFRRSGLSVQTAIKFSRRNNQSNCRQAGPTKAKQPS